MMKKDFIRLVLVFVLLAVATIVPAQNLPVLKPDPVISQGVLQNGLSYYIVTNPSVKGHADFALVQKTGFQTDSSVMAERAVAVAKDALASLPRIKASSPQAWLASHGVTSSRDGFITVGPDATVFRFNNLSFSSGQNVQDSTLLLLLTIVDRASVSEDEFVEKWYTPADQAIIVSGDVDAAAIASKLQVMSYMVPGGNPVPRDQYEWVDNPEALFEVRHSEKAELAYVNVAWRTPRAGREYMNTVQPAIYERFVNILGYIIERRVMLDLQRRGVPYAEITCRHRNSASGPGDEEFSISAHVNNEDMLETVGAISRACASVDAASVTVDEYKVAREQYFQRLFEESAEPIRNNDDYVDRCIAAFLYNASLASSKEKLELHLSRSIPDERQLSLFNDMSGALLDGSRNLKVTSVTDSVYDELQVRNSFYAAWTDSFQNPTPLDAFYVAPVVSFPGYGPKVKIESTKKDPMSGSTLWTFSNGLKVSYKKMNTSDKVYWTMAFNGGYGSISDLSEGEGAFVGDYLSTCRFGGVPGQTFKDYLMSEGMTMDMRVGITGSLLSGIAPEGKVEKVLQTLLLIANERSVDQEAFDVYRNSEDLGLQYLKDGYSARMTAIDSRFYPGYKYSWMKSSGKITEGFADKADSFYDGLSSRMNDGVLIIIADMDELEMRKLLLDYVGGFRTSSAASGRPSLRYQPNSGWTTYTVDGKYESIDVAMSAIMPLTMDNFMSASLAAMILDKALGTSLKETGMFSSVNYNFVITPQERLNLMVSVEPLSPEAYSSHIEPTGPIEALSIIRSMMFDLTQTQIPVDVLTSCKTVLKSRMAQRMTGPEYWLDAIAKRYLDGKDFTTSYAAKIDAISPEKIKEVFSCLNGGSKIEYVVRNR